VQVEASYQEASQAVRKALEHLDAARCAAAACLLTPAGSSGQATCSASKAGTMLQTVECLQHVHGRQRRLGHLSIMAPPRPAARAPHDQPLMRMPLNPCRKSAAEAQQRATAAEQREAAVGCNIQSLEREAARLRAELADSRALAERHQAAGAREVQHERERAIADQKALQERLQQLSSQLATAQVRAPGKPRQPAGPYASRGRPALPVCLARHTLARSGGLTCTACAPQAAAKQSEQQAASLDTALHKANQVALAMTDKVTQTMADAAAQAEAVKVTQQAEAGGLRGVWGARSGLGPPRVEGGVGRGFDYEQ